jgi:outer membrane protein assembly factor BamB
MRTARVSFSLLVLAAAVGGTTVGVAGSQPEPRGAAIEARIPIPGGAPFRAGTGAGYVWVLQHPPTGCRPLSRPCRVIRIDPATNRVVGKPTRLPADAWDLAVGAGSAWITQFDGRLVRIDARTGRITARISARPVYFGSAVAFGGGHVWIGNDDERNKRASVMKVDPRANAAVGAVHAPQIRSPQSVAFGAGSVWVADHAGWLVKIDPRTLRVVGRQPLRFGGHGVVATNQAVYVADSHGNRLIEVDPATLKIRRVAKLSIGPVYPSLGAGSLWTGSEEVWHDQGTSDDRVVRIDLATLAIADTVRVGSGATAVAFGFGSAWASAARAGEIVRLSP